MAANVPPAEEPEVITHAWDLSPAQARALQLELAAQVRLGPLEHAVSRVAGVDVGFEDGGATTRAAVVCCAWPGLAVLEQVLHREPTRFPYVPGLLSFRELPALLAALAQLGDAPDLVLCDGQGIAHPRRLGIAAHLGVLTGLTTIGVGKSRLCGVHQPVASERGAIAALHDAGERIGTVVRTRTNVRPLYVSPGNGVDHRQAVSWVLDCARRYRLPEPVRAADRLASDRQARRVSRRSRRSG